MTGRMAMEPECLEPLNLVIKKDDTARGGTVIEEEERIGKSTNAIDEEEDEEECTDSRIIENNMTTILQDACKAGESGLPIADQKILTALYMSSLMNMSNASTLPRNVTSSSSPPYAAQHNFVQLLAMLEARHRVWQQMNNWPTPQNFLRNPLGLPPQPYFADSSPSANQLTEQLCTSQNPAPSFPLSSAKAEPSNHEAKQTYFKR